MKTIYIFGAITLIALCLAEPAMAASSAGGGLPFDGWLTKLSNSITGPYAYAASVIALVATGSGLIFGGDIGGFMKTMLFVVLVLSCIIAAKNTLSALTGKGAEITKPASVVLSRR